MLNEVAQQIKSVNRCVLGLLFPNPKGHSVQRSQIRILGCQGLSSGALVEAMASWK